VQVSEVATLFDDDGILVRFMNSDVQGNSVRWDLRGGGERLALQWGVVCLWVNIGEQEGSSVRGGSRRHSAEGGGAEHGR
jgi:hypothetical protein